MLEIKDLHVSYGGIQALRGAMCIRDSVTTVLDTLQNGETSLAILDMSAACHTPDVIEMPYRPPLLLSLIHI